MADFEPRHQPELDRLPRQRIGAGDHGLAGDHGRQRGKRHHRDQRPIGKHQEKRVFHGFGIADHDRTLPQIIQRQRRQHDEKPGGLDRLLAEMTEVGVERLGAGDREKHGAQRHKADHAVMEHEGNGVERIEREQDFRTTHDLRQCRKPDNQEPDQHHRSEESGDACRAARLNREQRDQDQDGDRHDIGVERRGDELDAFDRRQHRERRRNDGVAVEQRTRDDAEQDDDAGRFAGDGALRQRHQRQRAALAMVVGAEQDHDILQGHHDDQRPQDHRDDAGDRLRCDLPAGTGRGNGFAKCI